MTRGIAAAERDAIHARERLAGTWALLREEAAPSNLAQRAGLRVQATLRRALLDLEVFVRAQPLTAAVGVAAALALGIGATRLARRR